MALASLTGNLSPAADTSALTLKRVLIVTAATGAGHNSVASSLQEALHRLGNGRVEVDVSDFMAQRNVPWIGRLGHLYAPIIVRVPRIWGAIYSLSDNDTFCRFLRMVVGIAWGNALVDVTRDRVPHAIVCVHPVCNQIIAQALRRTRWPVPLLTVITDLQAAHAAWVAPEVGLYVAPTEEIRASLLARAVDPARVKLSGLPLDQRFYQGELDREQARQKMGLREKTLTLLLTGGGEGAGAICAAARAISRARLPVQLIIVCGRNEALRRELERSSLAVPHRVVGFEQDMSQIVKTADVVIGKAGALTIGEAIAAQRPMIILHPLPGQEMGNMAFVRRHGLGLAVANVSSLIQTLQAWLANPGEMRALAVKGYGFRFEWAQSASRVASTVLELVTQREWNSAEGVVRDH